MKNLPHFNLLFRLHKNCIHCEKTHYLLCVSTMHDRDTTSTLKAATKHKTFQPPGNRWIPLMHLFQRGRLVLKRRYIVGTCSKDSLPYPPKSLAAILKLSQTDCHTKQPIFLLNRKVIWQTSHFFELKICCFLKLKRLFFFLSDKQVTSLN